ncbi:unnamed protein product, partial [Protopolystoma xenopodis]
MWTRRSEPLPPPDGFGLAIPSTIGNSTGFPMAAPATGGIAYVCSNGSTLTSLLPGPGQLLSTPHLSVPTSASSLTALSFSLPPQLSQQQQQQQQQQQHHHQHPFSCLLSGPSVSLASSIGQSTVAAAGAVAGTGSGPPPALTSPSLSSTTGSGLPSMLLHASPVESGSLQLHAQQTGPHRALMPPPVVSIGSLSTPSRLSASVVQASSSVGLSMPPSLPEMLTSPGLAPAVSLADSLALLPPAGMIHEDNFAPPSTLQLSSGPAFSIAPPNPGMANLIGGLPPTHAPPPHASTSFGMHEIGLSTATSPPSLAKVSVACSVGSPHTVAAPIFYSANPNGLLFASQSPQAFC